jgi:hypothetical protein
MVVGVYTSAFPCFGRPDGDHVAMSARAQGTSAADRVYRWLRGHILDGTIAGGRLLSEGEIAEAVQVSRTPVREHREGPSRSRFTTALAKAAER